ncbi:DUF4411 family protein [Marinomonas mediterranea]|jgi:hypothetical protein|uniref:DUF4411 family protein n=1 Tax=Marinomonas mediterranea (strain ATCC 700492 / JCM 21426 / NBRC 103028 / MMB-1) TaxID=717774 RepID=F2K1D9_MARM1|nr:DUF4411 family protein [Marinomonas mediterranea]ADZ91070.1 hypothetical protein Marme_1814 [Marinomonas mediterranea MMB-1]WCN13134.1 DUF4411 family protein [Marinomonas mediterranea]WCN17205.1 DUF4411 family protein [Marinomonas mediterranea MMB-1]
MLYLLDANIYIQAQGSYYDMDFCPGFWAFLDKSYKSGQITSIKQVQKELKQPKPAKARAGETQKQEDKLSLWVKERDEHFIDDEDDLTQNCFVEVVEYLMDQPHLNEANRDSFLDGADPWIISKAMSIKELGGEVAVVTHEKLVAENSTKVKVPNVCKHFGIEVIDCFTLLRTLEARFSLSA